MTRRQVHGRAALVHLLLVLEAEAVCCSMNRATTPDDRRWAAHIADELAGLAVAARTGAEIFRGSLRMRPVARVSGRARFRQFFDRH